MNKIILSIRGELKNYIVKNNLKSLVLGVSGGIDSALVAALAKPVCDELGIKLYGRSIPIITNKKDEVSRAFKVGKLFCHDFEEMDVTSSFKGLLGNSISIHVDEILNPHKEEKVKFRLGNIKARLRMIILYDLAQKHDGMVLSTDNYTEFLLGFSTIMGDWGDFGMIQNLWKTEVYDMAEFLMNYELKDEESEAMKKCIECDATDGLGITDTDLEQILPGWKGSSREGYGKVDKVLQQYLKGLIFPQNDPIISRHLRTSYKRLWPINLERNKIFNT